MSDEICLRLSMQVSVQTLPNQCYFVEANGRAIVASTSIMYYDADISLETIGAKVSFQVLQVFKATIYDRYVTNIIIKPLAQQLKVAWFLTGIFNWARTLMKPKLAKIHEYAMVRQRKVPNLAKN